MFSSYLSFCFREVAFLQALSPCFRATSIPKLYCFDLTTSCILALLTLCILTNALLWCIHQTPISPNIHKEYDSHSTARTKAPLLSSDENLSFHESFSYLFPYHRLPRWVLKWGNALYCLPLRISLIDGISAIFPLSPSTASNSQLSSLLRLHYVSSSFIVGVSLHSSGLHHTANSHSDFIVRPKAPVQ